MKEIEYMISKFPQMTHIWIHDDSFFLKNERVVEFCDEIVRRGISLKFICSARFKPLSSVVIAALERAGFAMVLFGLESGSKKILQSCHKNISTTDVIHAFRLFAGSPINIVTFLIVGLPGETWSTARETIALIKQVQRIKYAYFDDIGILNIYPGTEVYEIAKRAGMVSDDYWMTEGKVPPYTVEHSLAALLKLKEEITSHISLRKIITAKGFLRQIAMFPHVVKWGFQTRRVIAFGVTEKVRQRLARRG